MTSSVLGTLNTKQSVEVALFFESHRNEILDFWEKLVTIESGTMDKNDLGIMRDYLVEAFQSIGGTVQTIPYKEAGDLIVVDFFFGTKKSPIIFSGHYDTVFEHGTIEKRPFTIKEGRAYGPGVLDMKAGITMLYFIIQALQHISYDTYSIRVVLAGDEESGHQASTAADDFKAVIEEGRDGFAHIVCRRGGRREKS